ncbi:hypothetical protein Q9L58_009668 [Maublancomyces gigas]|uniref:Uncharacterized protein n=1 Tax=Discina gigas TaxID=1032678 RepID=A0ABR3G6A0_9PEZI
MFVATDLIVQTLLLFALRPPTSRATHNFGGSFAHHYGLVKIARRPRREGMICLQQIKFQNAVSSLGFRATLGQRRSPASWTLAQKSPSSLAPRTPVGGRVVHPLGTVDVTVLISGSEYPINALVLPDKEVPVTQSVILGMDWLELHDPVVSFENDPCTSVAPRARSSRSRARLPAEKLMALGFIRRKPNPDVNPCSAFTVPKPRRGAWFATW